MARKLRFLPGDDYLVEVTCRVLQRRYLLRPSPRLNAIILGALAHFQKLHGMRICGFVYLSNHCHLLLRPNSVQQLAGFLRDVNSRIAREAGQLHAWREKFWGRRYTDVVVSHEPEAQIARLRYLLEQGCKEALVASPRHWPGATSTPALASGRTLEGIWVDRTGQYRAAERGKPHAEADFSSSHAVELSPLPCWDELTTPERQTRVRAIIREIERATEGVEVLGRDAICQQDPHSRPSSPSSRRPAPRLHAVEPQVRRALELGYHLLRAAFRQAAEEWRAGKESVVFPAGCFVPGRFAPLRS